MPPELVAAVDRLEAAVTRLAEVDQGIRKRRGLMPAERELERALRRAWRAQGRDFVRRLATLRSRFGTTEALREAIDPVDWEPLFTASELATIMALREPLTVAARISLLTGVRHALADFAADLTFSLADPGAVAYLEEVGAARVTGINETTRSQLRTLLTEARASGWSYDKTADEIQRLFRGFSVPSPLGHIRSRAHLVAVTETASAYEHARRMMADRLAGAGLVMEKEWMALGNACPICLDNDAGGWIPIETAFDSGDGEPPAHPGCRCSSLYRRVASDG